MNITKIELGETKMTTITEIREWLERGRVMKDISHMLVVCDTFDWEDYPVYVSREENIREKYSDYNGKNMQRVMEVYSYNRSIDDQLKMASRVFNFD